MVNAALVTMCHGVGGKKRRGIMTNGFKGKRKKSKEERRERELRKSIKRNSKLT